MSYEWKPTATATFSPSVSAEPPTSPQRSMPRAERLGQTADKNTEAVRKPSGFLFSPTIDLLFIANLFWPLLLLVDVLAGVTTHESLIFWQIYFITAPHRWITLVLVTLDHEKTADRRFTLAALAIGILLVCLCLRFGTGSLLCLGVIDYVWNAWHFSSQHHGIFRIYERKGKPNGGTRLVLLEKLLFRTFLLYVIARVAGWGWEEGPFAGSESIARFDWILLSLPLFFVIRQLVRWWREPTTSLGSVAYLVSVMTLFTSMLMAAHLEKSQLVIQLALASAVFHSIEYLSIVTWSMQRSRKAPASNIFAYLSTMWLFFLATFVVVIGAGNYLLSRGFFDLWVLINLIVAFWHYCFDGFIWKSRKRSAASSVLPQGAS